MGRSFDEHAHWCAYPGQLVEGSAQLTPYSHRGSARGIVSE